MAASPRMDRTNSAPKRGRNVTMERSGQLLVISSAHLDDVPGYESRHADQHGEGVVVEIAALQRADLAGDALGGGGDAIRTDAVDQGAVTALPEGTAELEGRTDEQEVVQLVEIPLVVDEAMHPRQQAGQEARQRRNEHVHDIGQRDAGNARHSRQQADQGRHMLRPLHRMMVIEDQDRLAQKLLISSPTKLEWPRTPAKMAPAASTISGRVITAGLSWTWAMTCSSARGLPWKATMIRRQL